MACAEIHLALYNWETIFRNSTSISCQLEGLSVWHQKQFDRLIEDSMVTVANIWGSELCWNHLTNCWCTTGVSQVWDSRCRCCWNFSLCKWGFQVSRSWSPTRDMVTGSRQDGSNYMGESWYIWYHSGSVKYSSTPTKRRTQVDYDRIKARGLLHR